MSGEAEQATLQQMEALKDIQNEQPMIGEVMRLSTTLLPAYENATNTGYVPAIHYLDKKYAGFRNVRRDGNCFYRAFLFSFLEKILSLLEIDDIKGKEELERITAVIIASKEVLVELGFAEFAFECFYDVKFHYYITLIVFFKFSNIVLCSGTRRVIQSSADHV